TSATRMIHSMRLPLVPIPGGGAGVGGGDGEGEAVGAGLGLATLTAVTGTWTPAFGLPLVITGTPPAFRQVEVPSPTSAVTTYASVGTTSVTVKPMLNGTGRPAVIDRTSFPSESPVAGSSSTAIA